MRCAPKCLASLGLAVLSTLAIAHPAPGAEPAPGATVVPCGAPAVGAPVVEPALAGRLLALVNETRSAHGVHTLRAGLGSSITDAHAMAMATAGSIWHNADWLQRATRDLLGAGVLGENVGCHGTVEGVHQAFLASPRHQANVLDARFTAATFSVARRIDTGTLFVVEGFVQERRAPVAAPPPSPAAAPLAPSPAPAPAPAPSSEPAPQVRAAVTASPPAPPESPPAPVPPTAAPTAPAAPDPPAAAPAPAALSEPRTGSRVGGTGTPSIGERAAALAAACVALAFAGHAARGAVRQRASRGPGRAVA